MDDDSSSSQIKNKNILNTQKNKTKLKWLFLLKDPFSEKGQGFLQSLRRDWTLLVRGFQNKIQTPKTLQGALEKFDFKPSARENWESYSQLNHQERLQRLSEEKQALNQKIEKIRKNLKIDSLTLIEKEILEKEGREASLSLQSIESEIKQLRLLIRSKKVNPVVESQQQTSRGL